MNILISGIHGFIGSNLVSRLKQQHTIYGLDIKNTDTSTASRSVQVTQIGQPPASGRDEHG